MTKKNNNKVEIAKSALDRWGTAGNRARLLEQEFVHIANESEGPLADEVRKAAQAANDLRLFCNKHFGVEFAAWEAAGKEK